MTARSNGSIAHGGSRARGVGVDGQQVKPIVQVRNLVKQFRREDGRVVRAIDGVDLDVYPGEMVVLLGPSGCGKTTLLRAIAGLERPDSGTIVIHGEKNYDSMEGIDRSPERRRLNMIFQSYALWPHMTAFQNVAYPLQCDRTIKHSKDEIAERVSTVLQMVGIPDLHRQYPSQMSGGQQQRVALARALVGGDGLILLDEPLSNVDAKVREQLRFELIAMQRDLGFSGIFVTHDQVEAMELASYIAVMREGQVAQFAPPRQVYETPATRYVANFIGTSNELQGVVSSVSSDAVIISTKQGDFTAQSGIHGFAKGDRVVATWRPERFVTGLRRADPGSWNFQGTVHASVFVGSHTEHVVSVGDNAFRVWNADPEITFEHGSDVMLSVSPRNVTLLPLAEAGVAPSGSGG